ncbi:hypothetical protein FE257_007399 [Aspergillus nanangensis]|uniref:Cell-cycle control medial ring component-domain-containing protein n=1 Tax=Aspergillus nanangensis TaxID=2582783 RepID=A0AAD4CMR5_ASPNN|nr:hypothetical protein FE257_007399 [Aspergillus nanangensis]
MSELTFIKSYLSSLDSRPIKLPADYVFDPEQVGLRIPYMLPRLQSPHPEMAKKVKSSAAPGSSKSITVNLKSARNPSLEFRVPNAPLATTSVQDLKDAVQARVVDAQDGIVPLDKIKILYKRKPVTGKTIAEILSDEPTMLTGGKEVEFGIMIMGGAKVVEQEASSTAATPAGETVKPAAVGPSGEDVLESEAFWNDLEGYLGQRVKDNAEAAKLRTLFKNAWMSSR